MPRKRHLRLQVIFENFEKSLMSFLDKIKYSDYLAIEKSTVVDIIA